MYNNLASKFIDWLDERFPLKTLWKEHMSEYYAPKNFNFWYYFGSLALLVFGIQIISGIWLTMFYNPSSAEAFDSVEYIMRDIRYGWLIRYIHSTGASFFFIVVYLHVFRGLLYGSYKKPRELLWIIGVVIFLCLLAECFFGYLLPWGNMSFWGAQVITSLFGAIPVIGASFVELIRGDYTISGATLNRFFSIHVSAMPLIFLILIMLHLIALHEVGSNNPDGIEIKKNKDIHGIPIDGIPMHPYYTVKDLFGVSVFFICFFYVVFFSPEFYGFFLEAPNFAPADQLATPEHIAPVWYMTPYYAILRAIPNKLAGVIAMGASIAILFVLPWLDRSPVKSIRYKGIFSKIALIMFIISFFMLGYLGMEPPSVVRTFVAQICSFIYFGFFLLMPIYSSLEKTKELLTRLKND
ncbi:MAG TPA: cytochrome bc complex cytochrome b subunit [Candidatus Azoamicus sp. OHIO2]